LRGRDAAPSEEPLTVAAELVGDEALAALLRLSDFQQVAAPVCYPFTKQQGAYSELEGNRWFANNDRAPDWAYQHLAPLTTESSTAGSKPPDSLPKLEPR